MASKEIKRLDQRHYTAITMLVAGHSTEEIGRSTGVGKKSIEGWKRDPEFNKLYRQALNQCYEAGMAELILGASKAVKELLRIVDDNDVGARTKLAAINILLTHSAKVKDSHLELRLEELEKILESNGTITISAQEVREESDD